MCKIKLCKVSRFFIICHRIDVAVNCALRKLLLIFLVSFLWGMFDVGEPQLKRIEIGNFFFSASKKQIAKGLTAAVAKKTGAKTKLILMMEK